MKFLDYKYNIYQQYNEYLISLSPLSFFTTIRAFYLTFEFSHFLLFFCLSYFSLGMLYSNTASVFRLSLVPYSNFENSLMVFSSYTECNQQQIDLLYPKCL